MDITLLDGTIIEVCEFTGHGLKPLQEIVKVDNACDICPLEVFCQSNNEFDCQVYGMFAGYYFGITEAIEFVKNHKIEKIEGD